jgi:transcription elongation factor Elf1
MFPAHGQNRESYTELSEETMKQLDDKISCYECQYIAICHLKLGVNSALMDCAKMLRDAPSNDGLVWTDVYSVLAAACDQFTPRQETETQLENQKDQ